MINKKDKKQFSILYSPFSIILWDFDGVILDSMSIKTEGFRELFKNYDNKLVEKFIEFHLQNGGMPRFEKIKYFYNNLLGENITNEKVNELAETYGKIIEKKLFNKNNLIEDSVNFIKNNYKNYDCHIVSGAEHNELNKLCKFLEIDKYFISINGSPTLKKDLIKNLIKKYNYDNKKMCLIGDSINDYKAARENGIVFFGYNNKIIKNICDDYIERFSV